MAQPVGRLLDLLTLVEDVGDIAVGAGECRSRVQHDRDSALHIATAQTEQFGSIEVMGEIPRRRDRVQVATDQHPGITTEHRAGHHIVADTGDLEMILGSQGGLDEIGEPRLVAGLTGNVHEGRGECHDVRPEVECGRFCHADYRITMSTEPTTSGAAAIGLATFWQDRILDVWYPAPALGRKATDVPDISGSINKDLVRDVDVRTISTTIDDLAAAPVDVADVYLRLHLLSHRLVRPRTINLDGVFALLPNVAWTSLGPVPLENLTRVRLKAAARGQHVTVFSIDKFPRMVDYVVPDGVRIGDADRVRLGAHLGAGTTVMHEGFVNFNAGTLGSSMVEGRISAGVVVGEGSDVGGGASIMGTLSGGGKEVISVGDGCLIGANAGLGISLGDNSVIEAGCYVTAGAKITLPDGDVVRARELSGASGLLFRRNSVSGALEAVPRSGSWGGLNEVLHAHN